MSRARKTNNIVHIPHIVNIEPLIYKFKIDMKVIASFMYYTMLVSVCIHNT